MSARLGAPGRLNGWRASVTVQVRGPLDLAVVARLVAQSRESLTGPTSAVTWRRPETMASPLVVRWTDGLDWYTRPGAGGVGGCVSDSIIIPMTSHVARWHPKIGGRTTHRALCN